MIVIPMAGASSRFAKAGYREPKFMLLAREHTLFAWSVASFARYFDTELFVFICRADREVERFISEEVKALGIRSAVVVQLREATRGQAETVMRGIEGVSPDKTGVTIFNIDSIRPKFELPNVARAADGYLEVFTGSGANWSYVLPDPAKPGFAARTAEKEQISNLCSTGLYYFASREVFSRAYEAAQSGDFGSELFVAPLYNHLIADKGRVSYSVIDQTDVVFSGVPDEYVDFRDNSKLAWSELFVAPGIGPAAICAS